jgi:hypothetical protein
MKDTMAITYTRNVHFNKFWIFKYVYTSTGEFGPFHNSHRPYTLASVALL